MRIRNKEGFKQLNLYVDERMSDTINAEGWSWLDDAMEPKVRSERLDSLRALVREERKAERSCAGLSARKRWLELAYDAAVTRYAKQRQEQANEEWESDEDDLID